MSALGSLLIVLGACFFATTSGMFKLLLNAGVSKWALFFARAAVTIPLNLLIAYQLRGWPGVTRAVMGEGEPDLHEKEEKALLQAGKEQTTTTIIAFVHKLPGYIIYLRGIVAALSITFLVLAYEKYMNFADTFAIYLGLVTVCSNVLAAVVLKEHVHNATILGGALCIVGVFLVIKPPFIFGHPVSPPAQSGSDVGLLAPKVNVSAHRARVESGPTTSTHSLLIGMTLLFLASCLGAFSALLTRVMRTRTPQTLLHGLMMCIGLEGLLAMWVLDYPDTFPQGALQYTLALAYILFALVGQLASAKGFQHETLSIGSVLINTEMAFAFLIDATLLHEQVTALSICGAIVIFLGGGIATFRPGASSASTTVPAMQAREEERETKRVDGAD
jgi:drug/metabolite transporter (DMT)-like permease